MMTDNSNFQKMCKLGFHEIAHLAKSIDEIDFEEIKRKFIPTDKRYMLPRINFLGFYRHMSMTDQRHVCKALGFEYYQEVKFCITDERDLSKFTSKWRDITKNYSKLIVIGDPTTEEIRPLLFKKYKNALYPVIVEHNIPIIFESELIKMHPDYPDLDSTVSWKNLELRSTSRNHFLRKTI